MVEEEEGGSGHTSTHIRTITITLVPKRAKNERPIFGLKNLWGGGGGGGLNES